MSSRVDGQSNEDGASRARHGDQPAPTMFDRWASDASYAWPELTQDASMGPPRAHPPATAIPGAGTTVTAVPLGRAESIANERLERPDPSIPDMSGSPETVTGPLVVTPVDVDDLRGGRIQYTLYQVDGWDVDPTTIREASPLAASGGIDPIFETVRERDVDVLILEEFYSSPDFRAWWLNLMDYEDVGTHSVASVHHSLSVPGVGESDLVLRVRSGPETFAMLVEVKVGAPPQPDQARRYKIRRDQGIERGDWDNGVTCLVAPRSYEQSQPDEWRLYEKHISLEALRDWFLHAAHDVGPSRYVFKSRLLQEALETPHRAGVVVEVPAATAFWQEYAQMARAVGLDIGTGPKSDRSIRVVFRGQPAGRVLVHHLTAGYVDLQLEGRAQDVKAIGDANPGVVRPVVAGESAAFRLQVAELDLHQDPEAQREAIAQGLEAAKRLQQLGVQLKV